MSKTEVKAEIISSEITTNLFASYLNERFIYSL